MDELIARLERCDGPDEQLDEAIALATGWTTHESNDLKWWKGSPGYWEKANLPVDPPHFTGSLDAARTLVPEGRHLIINCDPNMRACADIKRDDGEWGHRGKHDNPAIALCIASLRARMTPSRPGDNNGRDG